MGMLTTLRGAIAKLLGFGQDDEGELLFASLEGGRSDAEPPSRQRAVDELLAHRQDDNGGNMVGKPQVADPPGEPAAEGEDTESVAESMGAGAEPVADVSATLSGEDAEADAQGDVGQGSENQQASAGFGDFSLDIFESEKITDEDEQSLPEGLVEIDVQNLLGDCTSVAERLTALPRHQVTVPGKSDETP